MGQERSASVSERSNDERSYDCHTPQARRAPALQQRTQPHLAGALQDAQLVLAKQRLQLQCNLVRAIGRRVFNDNDLIVEAAATGSRSGVSARGWSSTASEQWYCGLHRKKRLAAAAAQRPLTPAQRAAAPARTSLQTSRRASQPSAAGSRARCKWATGRCTCCGWPTLSFARQARRRTPWLSCVQLPRETWSARLRQRETLSELPRLQGHVPGALKLMRFPSVSATTFSP